MGDGVDIWIDVWGIWCQYWYWIGQILDIVFVISVDRLNIFDEYVF